MSHYCYENDLKVTRLLFYALLILFIAGLMYASGMLQVFEDGSFIIHLGTVQLSGCSPLALCAR